MESDLTADLDYPHTIAARPVLRHFHPSPDVVAMSDTVGASAATEGLVLSVIEGAAETYRFSRSLDPAGTPRSARASISAPLVSVVGFIDKM